jgi:hypothetical protein
VHVHCLEQWLLARPERGGSDNIDCLQCELCSSKISAKILLAPISSIVWDQNGRKMLVMFCIRLAYRLYLLRRLCRRYSSTISRLLPWTNVTRHPKSIQPIKPRTILRRLASGLDLFFFAIIGSLSATLLWRDVRSFFRSANSLRRAHATIRLCPADGSRSQAEV